jgi:hypothetical protein
MNMDVKSEVLQAAMAKAILDNITPAMQQDMFLQAVHNSLFTIVDTNGYGPKQTTLQRICSEALKTVSQEIIANMLRTPAMTAIIEAEIKKGVEVILDEGVIAKAVAEKIRKTFTSLF